MYSQSFTDVFTPPAWLVLAHCTEHDSERTGAVTTPAKHANVPSTPPGYLRPPLARPRTIRAPQCPHAGHALLPALLPALRPPRDRDRVHVSLRVAQNIEYMFSILREAINIQYIVNT